MLRIDSAIASEESRRNQASAPAPSPAPQAPTIG